jgi:hypothetical protein
LEIKAGTTVLPDYKCFIQAEVVTFLMTASAFLCVDKRNCQQSGYFFPGAGILNAEEVNAIV